MHKKCFQTSTNADEHFGLSSGEKYLALSREVDLVQCIFSKRDKFFLKSSSVNFLVMCGQRGEQKLPAIFIKRFKSFVRKYFTDIFRLRNEKTFSCLASFKDFLFVSRKDFFILFLDPLLRWRKNKNSWSEHWRETGNSRHCLIACIHVLTSYATPAK